MKSTGISIIIPTYNEEKNVAGVLRQLLSQIEGGDEIIIVDSRSKDNTAKIAQKLGVRVLEMDKLGVGMARTHGAKNAKNEIIAFLDCDAELSKGWLGKIKKHFGDSSLEAVGGLDLYTYNNAMEDLLYNCYSRLVYASGAVVYLLFGNFWVPSNNGAFRKGVFLKLGGYGQHLCEDFEFTKRFRPKKAYYDYSMVARLSDRRFKKDGFFRTVFLWATGDFEAFFNFDKKEKAVNYKTD